MGRKIQIIAGPCSAESREQVMAVAGSLAGQGVDFFRAGLWKPRTRPGCFEGVGEKGLEWLSAVRKDFGMRVCTEVARAEHVDLCLRAGVDLLWLGARTVVNPFMVEEVASALDGVDIPVYLKNPVNQDIDLWKGAVERMASHNVGQIGLIHRGFSSFADMEYRNDPRWSVAVEMRSAYPQLPFLCDPSHMGGDRRYVPEISQKAMDLGFDGLMVEVHCRPDEARSDSAQQITPEEFGRLISCLRISEHTSDDRQYNETLERLRDEIDTIDSEILGVLSRRMDVSRRIGKCKKDRNVSIIQPARWDTLMDKVYARGDESGLSRDFVSRVFNAIHEASVAEQNKIIEK